MVRYGVGRTAIHAILDLIRLKKTQVRRPRLPVERVKKEVAD